METKVKNAESKINLIPVNGYVALALPKISKKTEGGLIKSPKQIEEEKQSLPRFVEVVAVGEASRFEVGQFVMIASGSNYMKIEDNGKEYGLIEDFAIVAIASGSILNEVKEKAAKAILAL